MRHFDGIRSPVSVSYSLSVDGENWSEPVQAPFACDEKGFCLIDLPTPEKARFVRVSFQCRPKARTELDEIWIFGRLK